VCLRTDGSAEGRTHNRGVNLSDAQSPASAWSALADLLDHLLHGLRAELPDSLGLAVSVRYPQLSMAELEVLATDGACVVLAPAQVHRYGGPIVDAFGQDSPVRSDDLWADPRWPELTRENLIAHAPGYRESWERAAGTVAVPGHSGDNGSLVLSTLLTGPADERSTQALRRQEPVIRAALDLAVSVGEARRHAEATLEALRARVIIEQAKGLIIAVRRCPADEAWETLRRASQEFNIKLRELAVALVEHVGDAPAEQPGLTERIVPSAAAREAAAVTWQALNLPAQDGPAGKKDQHTAPELRLPQLGMLRLEPFREGSGLRITGEIDSSGHDRWSSALAWAVRQGRDVHLDMAGLQFIDGHGVAILESAARSLRKGRWLVLHQPPPMVRRILDLLWPEGESTIAIKDERPER